MVDWPPHLDIGQISNFVVKYQLHEYKRASSMMSALSIFMLASPSDLGDAIKYRCT